MARINNLTNFLNDVAAAIKEKLGDSTNIPAAQFDTKIREIETGGDYQSKTINISANGSQTIAPDSEYDALSSVVINVQVPIPSLQSKTYNFTENTHIVLSPETGYDGFSSIELTINVPTGSGDVKLFETQEEMQADKTAQEGDLAVVYRNDISNWDGQSEISGFTFPSTVVLSSSSTGRCSGNYDGGIIDGQVTNSYANFEIDNWMTGYNVSLYYESSDGLTYTRMDGGPENITFENPITPRMWQWTDVCGNFLQTGSGRYFGGFYMYHSDYEIAPTQLTLSSPSQLLPNKIGYGENGIVIGDGSIYDDMTVVNIDTTNSILTSVKLMSTSGVQNKNVFIKPAEDYTINNAPIAEIKITPLSSTQFEDKIEDVILLKSYKVYTHRGNNSMTFYVCNLNDTLLYKQTISLKELGGHYYCQPSSLRHTMYENTFMRYQPYSASEIYIFTVTDTKITYFNLLSSNNITSTSKYFGIYYKNNKGYLCLQTSTTSFKVYKISGTTLTLLTTITVSYSEQYVDLCEDNNYVYFSIGMNSYATIFCINKSTDVVSIIASSDNTSKKLLGNDGTCYALVDKTVYTLNGTTLTSAGVSILNDITTYVAPKHIYLPSLQKIINVIEPYSAMSIMNTDGTFRIFTGFSLPEFDFSGQSTMYYGYTFTDDSVFTSTVINTSSNDYYLVDFKVDFTKTIDNSSGDIYCSKIASSGYGQNWSTVYAEFVNPNIETNGGNLPSINAGEYEYVKTFTMDSSKSTDGYLPMVDVYNKGGNLSLLIIRNISSVDTLHVWFEGDEDTDMNIQPQGKSEYLYESDEPASNIDVTHMHNVSSFDWIKPT